MRAEGHEAGRWARRKGAGRLRGVLAVSAALSTLALGAARAGAAAPVPQAGLSIVPAGRSLAVAFVADSSGFSGSIVSYRWSFGDGSTTTTKRHTVTHVYRSAGRFFVTVNETAANAETAVVKGTVRLLRCPVGTESCSVQLTGLGSLSELRATGPISPAAPAAADLFVAPFEIPSCETSILPAVALTDSGFTGKLTVTLEYRSSAPKQAHTTCFSSTVAFLDAAGKRVYNGLLPVCNDAERAPCVKSVRVSDAKVTKVLIVPAGDPKVGAP